MSGQFPVNKAIIITIDGLGIGELPDAPSYNDAGSHTLDNISRATGGLRLPCLCSLGLGLIDGVETIEKVKNPIGGYGRMKEASAGKDTTTGHWEIGGVVLEKPFPTYPEGLPLKMLERFSKETGCGWLWGKAASGSEIIERFGAEHLSTGRLIVYTSADSVFQIAAHEGKTPVDELYRVCAIARGFLNEYGICRVIARPFTGVAGGFERTDRRRDFSVEPAGTTVLDRIKDNGMEVIGIGKIGDIFCHRGVTRETHTRGDMHGIDETLKAMQEISGRGLVFTNLADTDTKYGHRNDAFGFKKALELIDCRLPEVLNALSPQDLLFITADHGCDPTTPSTDHTREYVPLLVYAGRGRGGVNLGTRQSFSDIGATISEAFDLGGLKTGRSFLDKILDA